MVCKYLLRFDDIAPNMNWRLFYKIKELLIKYKIKPILGVIPNNKDKELVEDAISALSNLGYNKNNVKNIVIELYEDSKDINLSELISKSLKKLGNKS